MTDIIDQACDLEQKMREFWLLRQKGTRIRRAIRPRV